MKRRSIIGGLLALAGLASRAASAHTPYRQWEVYRKKHLLIGCHRQDLSTWEEAKTLVAMLDRHLPEARARVARAPRPARLASLMATEQLDVAVLAPDTASAMAAGAKAFSAYGPVPLTLLGALPRHVLVARADFPAGHGWLVAEALDGRLAPAGHRVLPVHAGAGAFQTGKPKPDA